MMKEKQRGDFYLTYEPNDYFSCKYLVDSSFIILHQSMDEMKKINFFFDGLLLDNDRKFTSQKSVAFVILKLVMLYPGKPRPGKAKWLIINSAL